MDDSKGSKIAEKARKIAEKYSGAGQSYHVKYLGTQEVSSARGDAVIADCLKELRTFFKDVSAHLPKVTITLQLSGITVIDEKSQLESIKVPLDHISYVCLDPGDDSVFSFIVRSQDTISSKGLRLHAFVCHPQTAITFNRAARELFDFMARMMRAKKKMAQQQQQQQQQQVSPQAAATQSSASPWQPPVTPPQTPDVVPALTPPPPAPRRPPPPQPIEKRQQAVFDEWKDLEKELNDIGQELDIGIGIQNPITSTPTSSSSSFSAAAPTDPLLAGTVNPAIPQQQWVPFNVMTTSGSDPFDSSFFDISFGTSQPSTAATATVTTAAPSSSDPHLFDNPLFNGFSEKPEPTTTVPEMPPPLTSTPESKQLTYTSRPRPKGKVLDEPGVISQLSIPDTTGGQNGRAARDVSLSPTGEQLVQDILANTDPFQPVTLEDFQTPLAANQSSPFQPAPLPQATTNSSFFSPSSAVQQESIQLLNPLYQSHSLDGSFSMPFASPPMPLQQQPQPTMMMMMSPPGISMQPHYPAAPPAPMLPMMHQPMGPHGAQMSPGPMGPHGAQMSPGPMGPHGAQMPFMGMNSFDGVLSPTVISPPPPSGSSSWSAQPPPPLNTLFTEQKDSLFSDLLPTGALGSNDSPERKKKKDFEPEKKVAQPSLAELQENKKKEQEAAFRRKSETLLQDNTSDWPTSPFDSVAPTQSTGALPEPLSAVPLLPTVAGDQQVPVNSIEKPQKDPFAQVNNTMEDFDAVFQEVGKQEQNIESAFEVKFSTKPQYQPTPATNDSSASKDSTTAPDQKAAAPWIPF